MNCAACVVPAAPVRKKPSHKVEMVNQLLFGEAMRILKAKNNWLNIQSLHDGYEGWVRSNLIVGIEENLPDSSFVAGDLVNRIKVAGSNMHVPIGSTLPAFKNGEGRIGTARFHFDGASLHRTEVKPGQDLVAQLTMRWLNAPYLWGGRTPFGVDCSGFVQIVFKMMGINLLRDAKLQVGQGIDVKGLEEAQCGNLAFFRHKKRKITHVGILLSSTQIIHASGKVRIDAIDKKGIVNSETGKRTHTLVAIRKLW